jgi:NAD(P)-dependent dehydrogenase (short-subunit alcohol dehydrogenase family)
MAGTITSLSADVERFLATAPSADLPTTGKQLDITDPSQACGYAKRANQLRVEAAASRWGRLGARIVSVSPGIISTGMGHQELSKTSPPSSTG